jgi:glycosyltransferase involved in cell wall biosynthesis
MSQPRHVAHFQPASGGIADYAAQIEVIYKQRGYRLTTYTASEHTNVAAVTATVAQSPVDLCHFEIGAADGIQLAISRRLLRLQPDLPQLLTIHDSGIIVRHPLPVRAAASPNAGLRLGGKLARKALSQTLGPALLRRHLAHPQIAIIYLRADLATPPGSYFLPQPTYHQHRPPAPKKSSATVGFGGFWGTGKGIETLLTAWAQVSPDNNGLRLILGGDAGTSNDPYAAAIRKQAGALQPPVELPGFTPADQLDAFVRSLGVMILPYWPGLPNGTSAMAMRAAELAVPIIASDVPALRSLLGADGAFYVPPKDPVRLAAAIREFAANPKPFVARAATLQRRIYAEHGWETVGRRLQEIVAEVMEAHA